MNTNLTRTLLATGFIALNFLSSTIVAQPFVKKGDIVQSTNGRWGAMSFTVNGKIYAGGGYVGNTAMIDWQEYNPATGVWTPKTNYIPGQIANRSAGITFVINGKGYIGLGAEHYLSFNPSLPSRQLTDLWSYDPATDKWTQHAALPTSGRNSSAVFVINNKAYVVGGETNGTGTITNEVWEYDPATDKWTSKPAIPSGALRSAVGFSINNKGYITGGVLDGQSTPLKKLYEFNGTTWTAKADFPADTARQGAVAFVANNKAYVGLGGTYGGYPTTFFTYDPSVDKWAFLTDKWPAQGRLFGRAEVINNKAYIGFGWRLDGGSTQTFFKDWYEVDAAGLLDVPSATTHQALQLYPNPSSGVFHIKGNFLPNTRCSIYNMEGKKTATVMLKNDNTIDLSSYPAGQYILTIDAAEKLATTVLQLNK